MTNKKDKSLLYIAYHYPPILGSSGVHRTLAFTRHLAKSGWDVKLLTTHLDAYIHWDESQLELIPEGVDVVRAYARDTARHLSFKGKYSDWMAIPDRWQSWIPFAIWRGYRTIKKNKSKFIISTYPIASAHIIAYILHRLTGVPWIADLRDPMVQENYPTDRRVKRVFQWIEQKMIKYCRKMVVTTEGTMALYRERFPETPEDLWLMLPNGYDEELLDKYLTEASSDTENEKLRILHSGTIYPGDRDPSHFFQALVELKAERPEVISELEVWLRATGTDDYYSELLARYGIDDIVKLQPKMPFKDAIKDMQSADALLLLQANTCNYQIPAKAYEYIRVGKPILALTDPTGDTAKVMEASRVALIAPLDEVAKIKQAIVSLVEKHRQQAFNFLSSEEVKQFSRKSQAVQLEKLLNEL